jgi:hypothetical protein
MTLGGRLASALGRRWWAGLLAISVLSCGGGGGTAASPAATHSSAVSVAPAKNVTACMAVARQDVTEVFGIQARDGDLTEGPSNHITLCRYSSADVSLLVRLSPEIGDQEQKAYPFESPQAVSGLGDQALFSKTSSGTPVSVLAVLKGKAQIALFYSGPGDRLALLTSLAGRALARI